MAQAMLIGALAGSFLLAVPLELHLDARRIESLRVRARLSWLFGIVRLGGRRDDPGKEPTPPAGSRKKGAAKAGTRATRRMAGFLLQPAPRKKLLAFLRRILCAIRPRDLHLVARVGLGDPADTGRLWGILGPLSLILPSSSVHLIPEFGEPCLRFQARAHVRLIPIQLVAMTLAFLCSPTVVRALLRK